MLSDTSVKTYLNEIAPTLGARQILILEVFERAPGKDFSNSELAAALDWSINRVTPRVSELRKVRILEESRVRKCQITGRQVHAWKIKDQPAISPRAINQGPEFYQMPSRSVAGGMHVVKDAGHRVACSCRGYHYRGTCSHVKKVVEHKPRPEEMMASLF